MNQVKLLAMAPSGEVYFTKDICGVVLRHRPLGDSDPVVVTEDEVTNVVSRYAYDVLDVIVDDCEAAKQYVESRLGVTVVDGSSLGVTPTIAYSALRVMEQWFCDREKVGLIPGVVQRLLDEPSVCQDGSLFRELTDMSLRAKLCVI